MASYKNLTGTSNKGWLRYETVLTITLNIVLVGLFLFSSTSSVGAYADEILYNGDFEDSFSDIASSWRLIVFGNANAVGNSVQTEFGQSQRINITNIVDPGDDTGVYFRQRFDMQQGHVYRFTVSLKSSDGAIVRVQLRKESPYYEVGAAKMVALTDEWQEITIEGGLHQNIVGSVGINMLSTGTVEIDNASLIDITDEMLTNHFLTDTIDRTFFGIHFNKAEVILNHDDLPEIGYGSVRLWDNVITWADLEPNKGQWDFRYFDLIMRNVSPSTEDFIYTMGMTPRWARKSSNDVGSVPANLEDWRNYVRTVGTRYKGQILYYEIWNEASYSGFSSITPYEMVDLARIAREELLAIDPNIKIISPNIGGVDLPYLDEFLFYGGGEYIDIISYHVYPDAFYPEDTFGRHMGILNLRDSYNLSHLPIWNSEGAPQLDGTASDSFDRAVTARIYLLHALSGIERFYWYTWDIYGYDDIRLIHLSTDDYFGLRAGGIAYRELADWLVGRKIVALDVEDMNGLWHITLEDLAGQRAYILFHYEAETTFTIPSDWGNAEMYHLNGDSESLVSNQTIQIGIEPVLIITTDIMPGGTPEVTPEETVEVTPEVTPVVTVEVTPEVTPEETVEVTPEVTPEETVEVTPEITLEATVEVTPEVTPEETVEVTPVVTVEVTPEVTPVVTPVGSSVADTTGDLNAEIQKMSAESISEITLSQATYEVTSESSSLDTNMGTITCGFEPIYGDITIQGEGSTIDAQSSDNFSMFCIAKSGTLRLENATVKNADSANSAGAFYNRGTLILDGATISDNHATECGGAIYNDGHVIIQNSTIIRNSADNGDNFICGDGTIEYGAGNIIDNDAPTPAISGDDIGIEGSPVKLSSSATPVEANIVYEWSVTKNNVDYVSGYGRQITFTPDDNATYVISLLVRDAYGNESATTHSVIVTSVASTVTLDELSNDVIFQGESVYYEFINTIDSTTGFTYSIDCNNDGSFDISQSNRILQCRYNESGYITARGRVEDNAGVIYTTETIHVLSPLDAAVYIEESIEEMYTSGTISQGQPLLAKISQIQQSIANRDIDQAIHHIEVLQSQINRMADRGSLEDAERINSLLIRLTISVMGSL